MRIGINMSHGHVSFISANMMAGWNQHANSPGPRLGCVLTGHNTSGKFAPSRTVYGDLFVYIVYQSC